MLVYIRYQSPYDEDGKVKYSTKLKAITLDSIKGVSEVYKNGNEYYYGLHLENEKVYHSKSYKTEKEAEMAQYSTISILNALELYYERFKHVPEHHATPVIFQIVENGKLVPGKISLYSDTPIYTIDL